MKFKTVALVLPLTLLAVSPAVARDTVAPRPVSAVISNPKYAAEFEGVRFYFGKQKVSVVRSLGETRTNKKTNAFNKTDDGACEWVMTGALKALADDAKARGGNAVINIRSNYKGEETSSETTYMCGAGGLMAGVALIGTVAVVR